MLFPTDPERPHAMRALLHARESLMRHLRPALRNHGLTEQQWRVLSDLMVVDEIAASDLAAGTCLRASSLSRIIKDLEMRGYLTRRSQLEDLRRTLVSITPRGRGVMQQLQPVATEMLSEISDRFGTRRLDELIGLSRELTSALGGAGEPDADA